MTPRTTCRRRSDVTRLAVALHLALAAVLALSGCSGGGEPRDILDGKPRVPDDEGVATSLSFDKIVLDGERTYSVSPDLIAFSTYTLELEPMLRRRGQYVQIGLDGDTMVWMAGVGAVLPVDGSLRAYYTGVLERIAGGRAQFRDGTVLAVDGDVETPELPRLVQIEIDVEKHAVVAVLAASGPATTSTSRPGGTTGGGDGGGEEPAPASTTTTGGLTTPIEPSPAET